MYHQMSTLKPHLDSLPRPPRFRGMSRVRSRPEKPSLTEATTDGLFCLPTRLRGTIVAGRLADGRGACRLPSLRRWQMRPGAALSTGQAYDVAVLQLSRAMGNREVRYMRIGIDDPLHRRQFCARKVG